MTNNKENRTNIEKFLVLEEKKQNRIINTAMKEFCHGYKKASTDAIVKNAGISKGLLFHYFGTKLGLFKFLVDYGENIMKKEYRDIIELGYGDVIEGVWKQAILAKDILDKHPYLQDFITACNLYKDQVPNHIFRESVESFWNIYEDFQKQYDTSLFRDDIEHKKAVDIIFFTIESMIKYHKLEENQSYNDFLTELKDYINIFKTCFYKIELHHKTKGDF